MKLAAEADTLPFGGLGEGYASVGDHPAHELGHCLGGCVVGEDARFDAGLEQQSHVVVGVLAFGLAPAPPAQAGWPFKNK